MVRPACAQTLHDSLASLPDPEIPSVTISELAMLQEVRVENGRAHVVLRPTHLGCPAFDRIRADVRACASALGYREVQVEVRLTPPWSSDELTPGARAKLEASGIACAAPPAVSTIHFKADKARCPHCGSRDTEVLAPFGTTACKSLLRCRGCGEPFDLFKRGAA